METVIKIFAFIFAIFILTLIHEYGHFIVARRFGVKILRFSIGFGKPIYTLRDKNNTEYVISALPFGGYVKMLDAEENKLNAEEKRFSFNCKPFWQRSLIVLAGPIANIIFAVFALWITFLFDTQSPKPIIGSILPNSVAYVAGLNAGDEITYIGSKHVTSWEDVTFAIFNYIGNKGKLTIKTKNHVENIENLYSLDLDKWVIDNLQPNPLRDLGIISYSPPIKPIIEEVKKNSPASLGGLHINDIIISIDGKKYDDWNKIIEYIKSKPNQLLYFLVERQHTSINLKIKSSWKFGNGWKKIGYIGAKSYETTWPDNIIVKHHYSPTIAIKIAVEKAYNFTVFNAIAIKKLISGKLPMRVLGGPIAAFQSSSAAIQHGLVVYIGFLGFFSLMLAFVNSLPIPGLDGFYVLLFMLEGFTKKQLSPFVNFILIRIGITILVLVMLQAFVNDIGI